MLILTGTVTKIEHDQTFLKREVTLKMNDNQEAFIEFRGPIMIGLLESIAVGDIVQIPIFLNGRISKNSGQKYNNLVAKTIKKLKLCEDELLR